MTPGSEPLRGEIWGVQLDAVIGHEQGGERPCLVISDDRFNRSRAELIVVLPITRTERGLSSHVRVTPPEGGLPNLSFVKCEDVRSISKQRLRSRWGKASAKTMAAIEDRMRILLSL